MGMWSKVKKYERVLIVALTAVCCGLILSVALALSTEGDQTAGRILPDDMIQPQNYRLIAKEQGGFLLISGDDTDVEEPTTKVVELNQDGSVAQVSENPVTISAFYQRTFIRGDTLFWLGMILDSQSLDQWHELTILDLEGESLADWDGKSNILYPDRVPLETENNWIKLSADAQGNCYGIEKNSGELVQFPWQALKEDDPSQKFQRFLFPEDMFRYSLDEVEVSADGEVYLHGIDWDTQEEAIWWMNANVQDGFPEDTLQRIAVGNELPFPADFISETLAVGTDGKLYTIAEDHSFLPLNLELETGEFVVSAATVSLTNSGTLLVKTNEHTISEYDWQNSTKLVAVYDFDETVLSFASNGDTLVLLHSGDVYSTLLLSDLAPGPPIESSSNLSETSFPAESANPPSEDSSAPSSEILSEPAGGDWQLSSGSEVSSGAEEVPEQIESEQFPIYPENNVIYIPVGTTAAQLKKAIYAGSGTLEVKKANGAVFSGGKVGTGMTVTLWYKGNAMDTVTIVVSGDINGSATVNSKDVELLYDYLLEESILEEPYFFAADWNRDGTIDTLDLMGLKQSLE
ncbi:MAG: hypothetical protein HFJ84_10510 [Clostridiales bacterium]|nr:hypothetical protein [Clostridiales bacterium]